MSGIPAARPALAPIVPLPVAARRIRTSTPMAAREARRFAIDAAGRLRPTAALDDIALLVGDLVNAAILADHRSVAVRLRSTRTGVRVEVDGDPATLDRYWPSGDVALVEAVAGRWGITEPEGAPVSIWFEVADDSAADPEPGAGD